MDAAMSGKPEKWIPHVAAREIINPAYVEWLEQHLKGAEILLDMYRSDADKPRIDFGPIFGDTNL
jgi:hypothetical protein